MRLSSKDSLTIKSVIEKYLGIVEIYLFGSRAKDNERGGDIDILVIGDEDVTYDLLLRTKVALKDQLGDQKIDLLYQQRDKMTPFGELAKLDGVRL